MKLHKTGKLWITLALVPGLTLSLTACGFTSDYNKEETDEPTVESVSETPDEKEEEESDMETPTEEEEELVEDPGVGPVILEDTGMACPSVNGRLQVIGSQLCDESREPIQLRGVSTHGLAWYPEYVNQDCEPNKDESSSIFASDVNKTSGFTYDDLSESGKWVYDMLQTELTGTNVGEATALP
ncbi:MAG: hypothetical protein LIO56_05995 [Lachnospiraceae bacterium]|nr:hypothetical protein [Lachnospiraceae bacterium]